MSAKVYAGQCFVYGVLHPKPPAEFPQGRIRWRLRCENFGTACVKTETGVRAFYVIDDGKNWLPGPEIGRNQTAR